MQIGTDQGLLDSPVALDNFMMAPGERMDVVVDFSGLAGQNVVLTSQPFEIMQFRVAKGQSQPRFALPAQLRPIASTPESSVARTRRLPLIEVKAPNGDSMMMLLNGKHWHEPVTEKPLLDSVEIWELVNTTEDSHPIHLHLVKFQLLDRRKFDELHYYRTREIRFTGPVEPPEPHERGFKDTIRAHSLMVTRIIVRFEGYAGRYVWHCHVLEHEDNDMMRRYEVVKAQA
jgi:spore coat protein A